MKQGTTALVATAIFLAGTTALAAQMLPPPGYYDARAYYGRPGPPPYVYAPYEDAMPSYGVGPSLRARGFRPLSGAVRRGGFYLVQALHPRGDEGRVVVDAYTGEIVRFIPARELRASSRNDEMVLVYQGPTFPPPDAARPPAPVPQLASRAPSSAPLVTPKPRPQSAPQKPETAQAPPVPAPVETKPAAASPPLVQKPVDKTPAVQPTQPLPPVQTLE